MFSNIASQEDIHEPLELILVDVESVIKPSNFQLFAQITIWSYVGVALRIFVSITDTIIPSFIYPQILGCFIIGIVSNSSLFLKFPHLKAGLSTGLCGSITSYSTFIFQLLMISRKSFWDGVWTIPVVLGVCFGALRVGQHLASTKTITNYKYLGVMESKFGITLFAVLVSLALIVLAIIKVETTWTLPILFAPFGSLSRYGLSKLNKKVGIFPFGTFIANTIACILYYVFYMIGTIDVVSSFNCDLLGALIVGFCGKRLLI
jgi:fluoride ion exporter CrcB/FEX